MGNQFKIISEKKINVAIVGCGRISKNHIKAMVMHHNSANLIALCDNSPERLKEAQNLFNESYKTQDIKNAPPLEFTDYQEMLKSANSGVIQIDLIVLATPSGFHSEQVIESAKAGIHVCTEKPMATKWSDGLAMVEACEKANVRLFVVKQNRFNSTIQLVKNQLNAKRFGKLSIVNVNVFWQRPQAYYDQDKWRGTYELDGGALMNQASHYVDLLDWLIGPVESISAALATIGRNIEVEDTAALQIKWKNGALGTMAVSMITYPKNLEGSITIIGEKGTVKIGGPAVNKIEHWTFSDYHDDDSLVEKATYETSSVYGFGHYAYYSNVLKTLQGKEESICDGYQGLKSLELITAAYKSAKEKRIINLPLMNS